MKPLFYSLSLVFLFSIPLIATAQSSGKDPSAALELRSTTQGFLLPRMTNMEQIYNIPTPALGLLIYNKSNPSLEVYDGARWIQLGTSNSSLLAFLDSDKDTGILLVDDQAGNTTIRFKTAGTERMSINASGTLHIKGDLKDAANASGTLGQLLSSTTTGTAWVDDVFSVFDAANQTGIRLDKNLNDDVIRFETAGTERMSINASGTVEILGALKDAADNDGTAGQLLSSTGSRTVWVDNPVAPTAFKNNTQFSALTSSTVSPRDHVVNTDLLTLNIRSEGNDGWFSLPPDAIYHKGPFDDVLRVYKTIVSPGTGRIWLDRNIGASQRATGSTDGDSYGHYFNWYSVTPGGHYYKSGPGKICPTGFDLPTYDEWLAEKNACITNAGTALSLPANGG